MAPPETMFQFDAPLLPGVSPILPIACPILQGRVPEPNTALKKWLS
jgi:hypothetical protein